MSKRFNFKQLDRFICSVEFFRHWGNGKMIYTEGIRFLVEQAKCQWLIDDIALVLFPQLLNKFKDSFYKLDFKVHADHSADLVIDDGNGNIHLQHKILWTDFPVSKKPVKFYLCESENGYCLMLPSEY